MINLNKKIYETTLHGSPVKLEVSALAGQANAAVIGSYGDTTVLATVVMSKNNKSGDFFPLTVDYEERFYAVGKILGSRFIRRENRPSDDAILSGRLIDRTIRPLFDSRLRREVQVVITVLSYDERHDPVVIGLLATSTALAISNIPWGGPLGGVHYASKEDESPSYKAFFAGPENRINMIEFEGKEISDSFAIEMFEKAQNDIQSLIAFQKKIIAELGKEKADVALPTPDAALVEKIQKHISGKIGEVIQAKTIETLKESLFEILKEDGADESTLTIAEQVFETEFDKHVHEDALVRGIRPDGRAFDEVRDLHAEIGFLKLTHGSGLFIRGTTQVLAIATLASTAAEQLVETMEGINKKRFMLHYNFPKFATGETGKGSRGPGRREIGHGALAAKAVSAIIPSKEEFPYAIRIVAETLSSNGSSSQASTCAASLALMDAGVPIKKHVAGIAIGLMLGEDDTYKILTDIQGPEDHYGDMDFKVAGTRDGVTAIQMDVKIHGITKKIFEDALKAGGVARMKIIPIMEAAIPAPRSEVSPYAPKVVMVKVPQEKIGAIIGSGGKTIHRLIDESEGKISIDIEDDGTTYVTGVEKELVDRAVASIQGIIREFEIGEIVSGPIVKIFEFGAIVDLGGGQDGMIHVSELAEGFVKNPEDFVKLGDMVTTKIVKIDPERGKIGLSLKAMKN